MAVYQRNLESPGSPETVTPSDSGTFPFLTRGIYVGGDGNISAVNKTGQTITIANVKAGLIYPFELQQIRLTGTTATALLAIFNEKQKLS